MLAGLPLTRDNDSTETIKINTTEPEQPKREKKYHRDPSVWDKPVPVMKAYRNHDFLNSSHARHLRILAEYEETMQRLRWSNVRATIQFFGSARACDAEQYDAKMSQAMAALAAAAPDSDAHTDAVDRIAKIKQTEWMVPYMASIQELARMITQWSVSTRRSSQVLSGVDRTKSALKQSFERNLADLAVDEKDAPPRDLLKVTLAAERSTSPGSQCRFRYLPHTTDDNHPEALAARNADLFVCTGGGPGFMEAANRGASMVRGGRSIGMGISLPFETGLNPYVTPELAFEYHYFFTRKFCMAYYMQALVAAPGGFGTMDELFELMTLKQTGKMNREMPIVLFGKKYWNTIVNWQSLAEFGVISQKEVDDLLFTDSVDEAFHFITTRLLAMQEAQEGGRASPPP